MLTLHHRKLYKHWKREWASKVCGGNFFLSWWYAADMLPTINMGKIVFNANKAFFFSCLLISSCGKVRKVRGLILGWICWIFVYFLCVRKNALVTIDIITYTQPYIIFPRDLNYLHWLCTYVQINKQQTENIYICTCI